MPPILKNIQPDSLSPKVIGVAETILLGSFVEFIKLLLSFVEHEEEDEDALGSSAEFGSLGSFRVLGSLGSQASKSFHQGFFEGLKDQILSPYLLFRFVFLL